jgi:hypothetical protein
MLWTRWLMVVAGDGVGGWRCSSGRCTSSKRGEYHTEEVVLSDIWRYGVSCVGCADGHADVG